MERQAQGQLLFILQNKLRISITLFLTLLKDNLWIFDLFLDPRELLNRD